MTTVLAGGERGLVAVQEQPYGWEVWERTDAEWTDRRVHDLTQLPSGVILAGTDVGLWASDDSGVSWRKLLDGNVGVVRPHPDDPTLLFAGVEPGVAQRSRDGGVHWERLETLGTSSERLAWRRTGSTPLTFVPGGRVTDYAFSGGASGVVYAAVEIGGIYRSRDGGASWRQCHQGLPTQSIHRLTTHPLEPSTLFAATDFGVYRSTNRGDDWDLLPLDAGAGYTRALTVLAPGLPGEPPALLAGPCEVDPWGWAKAADGARCRMYRSTDDGATWYVVTAGLPETFPHAVGALVSQPDDPDRACLGTGDGRVYLTRDRGVTWLQIAEELGPISSLLLLPDE